MFDALIGVISQVLTMVILADVLVSYFLQPYHPIREALDKIVQPMLDVIRRYLPQNWRIDVSPIILILLIEIIQVVLQRIFRRPQ